VPVVSSDNLVPDEFCDAYDQCAGDVDPFACFEQETNSRLSLLSCRLNFTGEGELCDPRETNLPDNSQVTDQCTWRQVGGTVQHGYLAGLRPIGSTAEVVSRLDQCKAKFAVQETQLTPPTRAAFVLWEEVNGTGQADDVVVIDLQVQQVADCDSLPPVPMCAGLPTLLPSD
jgi:hypothetical protein